MNSKIEHAAGLLRRGELVAFPTETVYGLGGNALSDGAVAKIYAAKNRPTFNPLIVHVRSVEEAQHYARFDEKSLLLARHFWPGPLTLVLPRLNDCKISLLASAGLDSIAMRVPAHPLALTLLEACGLPIAAPSANRSGKISPTSAEHVRQELGEEIAILDGGDCTVGIESTVVDMTGEPAILRPGFVTAEQLALCHPAFIAGSPSILMGMPQQARHDIKSPGMLESHYAPGKKLRLNATDVQKSEALLAFGAPIGGAMHTQNLSRDENLQEAAANLFRMLRLADAGDANSIAVMPIPETGLGIAINDRLRRAAS
jgi:L-threonylcarbamoyladenylate synthase